MDIPTTYTNDPTTYTNDPTMKYLIDRNIALKKEVEDALQKQTILKHKLLELGSYTKVDLWLMSPTEFDKIKKMRSLFHPKSDDDEESEESDDEESDDDDEDPFGSDADDDEDPFKK